MSKYYNEYPYAYHIGLLIIKMSFYLVFMCIHNYFNHFVCVLFCAIVEIEPSVLHMIGKWSTTELALAD